MLRNCKSCEAFIAFLVKLLLPSGSRPSILLRPPFSVKPFERKPEVEEGVFTLDVIGEIPLFFL